jgi:hypothetical protein
VVKISITVYGEAVEATIESKGHVKVTPSSALAPSLTEAMYNALKVIVLDSKLRGLVSGADSKVWLQAMDALDAYEAEAPQTQIKKDE